MSTDVQVFKMEIRNLPAKLKPEELQSRSDELAQAVQDIATEESRQKAAKDQMKARLTELQSKAARLASVVSRREEFKDVEVEIRFVDKGLVSEIRTDTGEVLITRPPHEDEKQLRLPAKG